MTEERKKYICRDCEHLGWTTALTGCKKCNSHNLEFADDSAIKAWQQRRRDLGFFRWELLESARKDFLLQVQHPVKEAKQKYQKESESCPKCHTPPDELSWFYFLSAKWTWEKLMGRAGWMVVCDRCKYQVSFFLEMMN